MLVFARYCAMVTKRMHPPEQDEWARLAPHLLWVHATHLLARPRSSRQRSCAPPPHTSHHTRRRTAVHQGRLSKFSAIARLISARKPEVATPKLTLMTSWRSILQTYLILVVHRLQDAHRLIADWLRHKPPFCRLVANQLQSIVAFLSTRVGHRSSYGVDCHLVECSTS